MASTHAKAQIVYRPEKNIVLTLEQSTSKVELQSHCDIVKASIRNYKSLYGADEKLANELRAEAERLENVLLLIEVPHKLPVNERLKDVNTNLKSIQSRLLTASTGLAGTHVVNLAAAGNGHLAEAEAKAAELKRQGSETMKHFKKAPKPLPAPVPEKPKGFFERWCCCFTSCCGTKDKDMEKPLLQPVADSSNGNGLKAK